MKTICAMTALTIAAAVASGCAAPARSPEPVPVDRVECARCRMLISSDHGGGQIVSSSADTRFYDDIACLAADFKNRSGDAAAFVRLSDGRWLDAFAASYAQPDGVRTAMGSGFAAFASIADARSADRAGHPLTFEEVTRRAGERP
jgi:nitrous oxide reductase accessory protein NosL